MAQPAKKFSIEPAHGELTPIKSIAFSTDVRFPGIQTLTKRMTVGKSGVSTVESIEADFAMRVVWITNRGLQRIVPFENVADMEI